MSGYVGYSTINNNFSWGVTHDNVEYCEIIVIHEFSHFIEMVWSPYLGYSDYPGLHDQEAHGYTNEESRAWHRDYINRGIVKPGSSPTEYYGIDENVWTNPPLSKR